ncbi:hypothetical protein BCR44DRAFT_1280581 [Catenaria anguillulae PL171]|uniref:Uncharacterized protein n=1 Tax=Catenaria anguillulae PL171 TaxID=765915 RepID=A0A1Y2H8X2_9FUNG|nr:hypothetical protein BCR44DRAFT_1280581 [Catenaria anguillulae PL171]
MTEATAKRGAKEHNQVHNDLIWRQMIQYEYTCASNWEKNWAFMKNRLPRSYKSNLSSKDSLPPISHNASSTGPSSTVSQVSVFPIRQRPTTSEAALGDIAAYNVRHLIRRHQPQEKYSFPATTAEMYGWQFGDKEKKSTSIQVLDRFARVAPGRVDTLKWWGGARESLP